MDGASQTIEKAEGSVGAATEFYIGDSSDEYVSEATTVPVEADTSDPPQRTQERTELGG